MERRERITILELEALYVQMGFRRTPNSYDENSLIFERDQDDLMLFHSVTANGDLYWVHVVDDITLATKWAGPPGEELAGLFLNLLFELLERNP